MAPVSGFLSSPVSSQTLDVQGVVPLLPENVAVLKLWANCSPRVTGTMLTELTRFTSGCAATPLSTTATPIVELAAVNCVTTVGEVRAVGSAVSELTSTGASWNAATPGRRFSCSYCAADSDTASMETLA